MQFVDNVRLLQICPFFHRTNDQLVSTTCTLSSSCRNNLQILVFVSVFRGCLMAWQWREIEHVLVHQLSGLHCENDCFLEDFRICQYDCLENWSCDDGGDDMENLPANAPESSGADGETGKADHDGQDEDDWRHLNYRSQPEILDESPPSLKNICKYQMHLYLCQFSMFTVQFLRFYLFEGSM